MRWMLPGAALVALLLYALAMLLPHSETSGARAALVPLLVGLALPALAVGFALRRIAQVRGQIAFIFVVGVLLRLLFLGVDPYLSDDVYRYLWDGRVQLAGLSPYGIAPDDARLDDVEAMVAPTDRVRGLVNHPAIATIYPPVTELLFRAMAGVAHATGASGVWMLLPWRLFLLVVDLATAGLVLSALRARDADPRLVVLYLWHPLPVVESIWSAHAEGVAVFLLVAAAWWADRGVRTLAGAACGLGGAAKLLPLFFLVYLVRRGRLVAASCALFAAIVPIAFYLDSDPHHVLDGVRAYAREWYFNDVAFHGAGALFGVDVENFTQPGTQRLRIAMTLLFVVFACVFAWRERCPWRVALWGCGAFVILTPTLHPWYLLWVLPFAVVLQSRGWLLFSITILGAHLASVTWRELGIWEESTLVRFAVLLPPLVLLWIEERRGYAAGVSGT